MATDLNASRDCLVVAYDAASSGTTATFTARKAEPPREEAGFLLSCARAIDTVRAVSPDTDLP